MDPIVSTKTTPEGEKDVVWTFQQEGHWFWVYLLTVIPVRRWTWDPTEVSQGQGVVVEVEVFLRELTDILYI